MRTRLIKVVKPTVILLTIGFIYIIIHNVTGFGLFCPINKFTGLYCPGCGVSRMFLELSRLNFGAAFSSNCVVFCLLPIFLGFLIYHCCRYIRCGDRSMKRWENILCIVCIVVLLAFAVVRNLFPIDILVP